LVDIAQFTAPVHWQAIDFISDLHLGPDTPATFEAFQSHLRNTPADAVFILGDLFEVWVGDDARTSSFEQTCIAALADAARRLMLGFMAGNRDFLVGSAALADARMLALADPTALLAFGGAALLTHGDALCLADVDYQQFRAEVRSEAWQQRFLAQPLNERRAIARRLRDASDARKRASPVPHGIDIDFELAAQWLRRAGTPVLVHGHTHRPASEALPADGVRHVLSDWDLEHGTRRAEVLRWTQDGFARVAPSRPSP
jgi:UDP-2,3-diacylglucosamine hydrolase